MRKVRTKNSAAIIGRTGEDERLSSPTLRLDNASSRPDALNPLIGNTSS